ncbi:MAG: ergothioneine biosynthesis protein EgtB [Actinomycetota bacterium]|nr:ergothioneine biosynthesis protein EgtB [Actinomycetota bacterium]MDQ2957223.1 ergothioneine biosynthesis protein EgtB [Actinomycetota bacterium]
MTSLDHHLDPAELTDEKLREHIAGELGRARQRSAALTDAVDEQDLTSQHSPLMSPLVWDYAHIANQEEIWLVRDVGGRTAVRSDIDEMYDAFKNARADRPTLPLLSPDQTRSYVAQVRDEVLDVVSRSPLNSTPLTRAGFAFGMVVQHEQQHDETMLATHQLRVSGPALQAAAPRPDRSAALPGEVFIPGGSFSMGTSTEAWALDNERPAHQVDVDPFYLDSTPVSNGDYAGFIDAGGYDDPRWWSTAGWQHRQQAGLVAPLFWSQDPDGSWWRRSFGTMLAIEQDEPVVHVCLYEAQAYATWAGRRLPTEAEWEKAARWDPATGRSRRYPWGDGDPTPELANLGQRHLRPAPVGSYPAGQSALGVHQLIGDVWEWTSSVFRPYPGFVAFPYDEYSQVFYGPDYYVLRGGSFGTDPAACRGTFRNWDYPIRRQIFAGFRTARDGGAS